MKTQKSHRIDLGVLSLSGISLVPLERELGRSNPRGRRFDHRTRRVRVCGARRSVWNYTQSIDNQESAFSPIER